MSSPKETVANLPTDADRRASLGLNEPIDWRHTGAIMDADPEFSVDGESAVLNGLATYVRAVQADSPGDIRILALRRLFALYRSELEKVDGALARLNPRLHSVKVELDLLWRTEPLLVLRALDQPDMRGKVKKTAADPLTVAALVQDQIDADPRRRGAKTRAFKAVAAVRGMPSFGTVRYLYYENGGERGARHAQRARLLDAPIPPPDIENQRASDDGMPEELAQ